MPEKETNYHNFEPNVAAALSYLMGPFTGIFFFLIEKKSKFVKFHAFQSILFGITAFITLWITNMLKIVLIGFFLEPVISLVGFCVWLFLMWKAYNNEEYELPYLGKIAKEQVQKH